MQGGRGQRGARHWDTLVRRSEEKWGPNQRFTFQENRFALRNSSAKAEEKDRAGVWLCLLSACLAKRVQSPRFDLQHHINVVWWHVSVILALRKWGPEVRTFTLLYSLSWP